jgi:hypothetical protein
VNGEFLVSAVKKNKSFTTTVPTKYFHCYLKFVSFWSESSNLTMENNIKGSDKTPGKFLEK